MTREWTMQTGGREKRPMAACWHAFLTVIALTGVLAGIATGSETAGLAGPGSAPVLSGCELDYPPYCSVTADNQADGFSVELLRAALKAMGREVVFKTGPWSEVMQDLVAGRLQALPLVGRSPEREALFDFTFPYLTMHGTIVVRAGNGDILTPADLKGRRVAVAQGENAEEYLRRANLGAIIVPLPSFETALRELAAGKYDAVVIQRLVALQLIQKTGLKNLATVGPPLKDFTQSFCFAVRKGDAESLAVLNEGLSIVMADGTFRRLHAKWFSAIEAAGRAKSRIVVGGDSAYPPYEFLDSNGQPAGYNVDLTRGIARQMGLAVDIRLDTWSAIRNGLEQGRIDAVQGMFYSAERDETFDFSPAYGVVQHVIVVRKGSPEPSSMTDLAEKSILVMAGDVMEDLVVKLGYERQLVAVPSQEDALRRLAAGEHDCALVAKVPALYWIKKHGWRNLSVSSQSVLSPECCYAVPQGKAELLSLLSEGLAALKTTGEYRTIQTQWLAPYEASGISLRTVVKYAAAVSLSLLALFVGSLLWLRSLKQQVAARTRDLLSERAFLDRIINAIADPVFVKDDKRRFVIVNDAFCTIVGRPREALINEDGDDMFPPDQVAVFRKMDAAVFDTGEQNLNEEDLSDLSTEKVRTIVTRKSRYTDPAGTRFLVGVIRDITERKQMEGALRQQQKLAATGTLARGMAHEINNPLTGIMNYAQLIKDRVGDNAMLAGFAGEIIAESQRVAQMTHSLLSFTQQADTQAVASVTPADLVSSVLPPAAETARQRGIALSCDISADLPPVSCHRGQIAQVMADLLANAMESFDGEYPGQHGNKKIVITAQNVERGREASDPNSDTPSSAFRVPTSGGSAFRTPRFFLRLTVEDNGFGIPPDIRERVFDPFFTTKDRTRHSGLGLWISRSVVHEHDGELTVESEVGKGSKVHVDLPIG